MSIKLYQLDDLLQKVLTAFLTLLTIAVVIGLIYLMESSKTSIDGTIDRWNGSRADESKESFSIAEDYPKPISEMLMTTHNHLFGFSFILVGIGLVFYFNSIISGSFKKFLIIEPFISVITTFGSIWLMRFYYEGFVYLALISATLLYTNYFIMYFVCMYELNFKKNAS